MNRKPLPQRRRSTTQTVEFHGAKFHISIGTYADNRPAELFCTGPKSGSEMASVVADAAVLFSLLLQGGATPADIRKSLGREEDGVTPASIMGVIADMVAEEKD